MENAKKQLKTTSLVILGFALLAVLRTLTTMLVGIGVPADQVPEGMTAELIKFTLMAAQAVSLVFVIPQIYVGYKGYKISKTPDDSKGHIVWATIILVLSVISLISSISSVIGATNLFDSILQLCIAACDVVIYFLFIKYAKELRNAQNG